MASDEAASRQRMVAGAADMIGRRGLRAASVRELAKHAGAPVGSTYHYFPGGKTQLATEAVRWADEQVTAQLVRSADGGSGEVVRGFVDGWRKVLLDSDFQRGCPVLAVAVEEYGDDASPRDAAVFAFSNWTTVLARSLRDGGIAPGVAADTATLIVAAVEGAVAMSRAERSVQPLEVVGRQLQGLLVGPV
jgi:AcrR family transcriptional regulator